MAKLPAQDIVERLLSPLAISKEHRDQAADLIDDLRAQLKQAASTRRSMSEALSELKARADALAQALRKSRRILGNSELHETTRVVDAIDAIDAALGDRP